MIDPDDSRRIVCYASLCGAIGVVLGAVGAHGLDTLLAQRGYDADLVAQRVDQFNTGVRYQLVHAVALLGLAALPQTEFPWRRWVGRLFLAGVLLFSGSLYLLVASNQTKLGIVTPLGGLSWIAGWILLGMSALRSPRRS